MEVESCKNPVSKHLPEKVVRACTQGMHTPINPHSQRLLTAEARSAGKVPKSEAKKKAAPKRKGNESKKPNKVESKPEASPSSGSKKKGKTEQEKQEKSGVSRTQYAAAKKEFMMMDELLVSILFLLYWGALFSTHTFLRS